MPTPAVMAEGAPLLGSDGVKLARPGATGGLMVIEQVGPQTGWAVQLSSAGMRGLTLGVDLDGLRAADGAMSMSWTALASQGAGLGGLGLPPMLWSWLAGQGMTLGAEGLQGVTNARMRYGSAQRTVNPLGLEAGALWDKATEGMDWFGPNVNWNWARRSAEFWAGALDFLTAGVTRRVWQAFGSEYFLNYQSQAYRYGEYAGQAALIALTVWNPGGALGAAVEMIWAVQGVGNALNAYDAFRAGHYTEGIFLAIGSLVSLAHLGSACLTEKNVGQLVEGWAGAAFGAERGAVVGAVAGEGAALGQRALLVIGVGMGLEHASEQFKNGDVLGGILSLGQAAADVMAANRSCFRAGTMLEVPGGLQAIETFRQGDRILAQDENDPDGAVEVKLVEAVFVTLAPVLEIKVRGRVIGTTAEHRFWVEGKGRWVPAGELEAGDVFRSRDGQRVEVEKVCDTGAYETVYNVRVSDYHTYFVSGDDWGFSVWSHNDYSSEDPWPPRRPQGPKPDRNAPGGAKWRYERYAAKRYEKLKAQRKGGRVNREDILSFQEWVNAPNTKAGRAGKRNGQNGTPEHQKKVKQLARDAADGYPNDIIHENTTIRGRQTMGGKEIGKNRRPDVWVEDGASGKVKKVYEAAHKEKSTGRWVKRERAKEAYYKRMGIKYEFHEV